MSDAQLERISVLVVEDGHEYTTTFSHFLGSEFYFERAGTGAEAIRALSRKPDFQVVFLDLRFDRTAREDLLGDVWETANRFNGDVGKATEFLRNNQGTYILVALRQAGIHLPVIMSHDFSDEPRRWANLERMYGPLAWLPDNAGPDEVRRLIEEMLG